MSLNKQETEFIMLDNDNHHRYIKIDDISYFRISKTGREETEIFIILKGRTNALNFHIESSKAISLEEYLKDRLEIKQF